MAQLCGACSGLLVFSAVILCGLLTGNPVEIIVQRAVFGLFAGFLLGATLGCVGKHIVRDNVTASSDENVPQEPTSDDEVPEAEMVTE